MGGCLKSVIGFVLQLLILNTNAVSVSVHSSPQDFFSSDLRVKRQAGYVYNKPSVSFDLPSRPTTVTQATNVDRTQAQQMYYAYPVPAGEEAVKIGYSSAQGSAAARTGATATAVTAGGQTSAQKGYGLGPTGVSGPISTGGYSYKPVAGFSSGQAGGGNSQEAGGYNYNPAGSISSVSGGGYNSESGGKVNIGTEQIVVNSISGATTNSGNSGYTYNTPTSTTQQTTLKPAVETGNQVSTSAPQYLPPISNDSGSVVGSTSMSNIGVNIGSGVTSSSGSGSSVAIPSENYLPPAETASKQTGVSRMDAGSVSLGSTYVPPNTASKRLNSSPSTSPRAPAAPSADYLPPVAPQTGSSTTGTVATPAATYLPPNF